LPHRHRHISKAARAWATHILTEPGQLRLFLNISNIYQLHCYHASDHVVQVPLSAGESAGNRPETSAARVVAAVFVVQHAKFLVGCLQYVVLGQ
jgi:hypothetical protein